LNLREKLYEIIFESDTPAGKSFDLSLIILIFSSVLVVLLESVPAYLAQFGRTFFYLELWITGIFTLEYLLRLYCARHPRQYALSFYGLIDLVAILPLFLLYLLPYAQSFIVLRVFRLLRIFRVFKLNSYLREGQIISNALWSSRFKIRIFFFMVMILVTLSGTLMYLIESAENGFDSIPSSMYWAIVTMTTVGYGDIVPATPLGKFIASLLMASGYAIIAVPTGIVSAEFVRSNTLWDVGCPSCHDKAQAPDAIYCNKCGEKL
jgi:voltage-gated potassium channel